MTSEVRSEDFGGLGVVVKATGVLRGKSAARIVFGLLQSDVESV